MPLSGLASVAARLAGKGARATKVKHPPTVHTPEFKKWFKNSEIIDEVGLPLPAYHSTPYTFESFKSSPGYLPPPEMFKKRGKEGLSFFSLNPRFASNWNPAREAQAQRKAFPEVAHLIPDTEGQRILPTYLSVQKLFNPVEHAHLVLPNKAQVRRGIAITKYGAKRMVDEVLRPLLREGDYFKNQQSMSRAEIEKYWNELPDVIDSEHLPKMFQGNYSKGKYWTRKDMEEMKRLYGEDVYDSKGIASDKDLWKYSKTRNRGENPYSLLWEYKELKEGRWGPIEKEDVLRRIKNQGFDGIKMIERRNYPVEFGATRAPHETDEWGITIGVWNPRKIKSVFNEGTWNPRSKNIGKEVGGMVERNPYPYQARAI